MLLTYSITKAKRVLCDVAQFVAQHFDHCNNTCRCRQEYRPPKPHSICFFYHNTKDSEINICLDNWKHQLELDNARAALCKLAACTRQTFLSETFTNSLNMQKQYEENVWETSNDTYSLSVRVQTTINHISIYFWPQHQHQRKCFSSERELKKALCDTLTRALWYGL